MITRFPILVLANYRTGSSTLAYNLSKEYNLYFFPEPLRVTEENDRPMGRLAKRIRNGKNNFIIKFMPDQMNDCQRYVDIYNSDCYKIKLQRRDKIAQIASYYVSYVSGIWHSNNPAERRERFSTPIYMDDIDFSIDLILDNEKIFATLDAKFDQELYYEDLNLESDKWVKLNAPANYNEICSDIKHRLQQRGQQI
jgi:hypothetical protein